LRALLSLPTRRSPIWVNNGTYPDAVSGVPFGCPSGFPIELRIFWRLRDCPLRQRPPGLPMESKPASAWNLNPSRTRLSISAICMYADCIWVVSLTRQSTATKPARCYGITPREVSGSRRLPFHLPAAHRHSARNHFRPTSPYTSKQIPSGTPSTTDCWLTSINELPSPWHGVSYTWSKGIDNGPNPSFVLIRRTSRHFERERAISADHVAHSLVVKRTITGPTHVNPIVTASS